MIRALHSQRNALTERVEELEAIKLEEQAQIKGQLDPLVRET